MIDYTWLVAWPVFLVWLLIRIILNTRAAFSYVTVVHINIIRIQTNRACSAHAHNGLSEAGRFTHSYSNYKNSFVIRGRSTHNLAENERGYPRVRTSKCMGQ